MYYAISSFYNTGLLLEKKIDFAVGHFGLNPKRYNVVDYLTTHNKPERGQIYFRNPKQSMDYISYLRPLHTDSWIGVIAFCAAAPVLTAMLLIYRKVLIEEYLIYIILINLN